MPAVTRSFSKSQLGISTGKAGSVSMLHVNDVRRVRSCDKLRCQRSLSSPEAPKAAGCRDL